MPTRMIPTHLKVLRGNPGKQALPKNEAEPDIPAECPEPPHFLASHAIDEWWRLAPMMHRLKLLTLADINPLAAYCQAYARWRTAEETLAKMAERDPATSALMVKSASGTAIPNPLVFIAQKAASDMVKYAGEFGLTPAARARIAAGPFDDGGGQSKFAGLLAG